MALSLIKEAFQINELNIRSLDFPAPPGRFEIINSYNKKLP